MATSNLKILREVNDYTQEEIANVLGISQNTYSRLERDPKNLTSEQAKKLSDFYNVSVLDLLSDSKAIVSFEHAKFDGSNNAYVNQVDNDNRIAANASEINSLKEEIAFLRKQNEEFMKLLAEKK